MDVETHETFTLTTKKIYGPAGVDLATAARLRWGCADAILYINFVDFLKGRGCYAITLRGEPPEATHVPKALFDALVNYATRVVDVRERSDQLTEDRGKLCQAGAMYTLQRNCLEREKKKLRESDHRNKLSTLRDSTFTDFAIVCNDGKTVNVHKAVLASFWPFFRTMLENKCKETEENKLCVDYSSEIVELMVSDLYGRKIEFTHTQALPLMQLADTHRLPELFLLATEKLEEYKKELKLADCIEGWRQARTGNYEEGKKFFSGLIAVKSKGKKRLRQEFESIDRDEALELFLGSLPK